MNKRRVESTGEILIYEKQKRANIEHGSYYIKGDKNIKPTPRATKVVE